MWHRYVTDSLRSAGLLAEQASSLPLLTGECGVRVLPSPCHHPASLFPTLSRLSPSPLYSLGSELPAGLLPDVEVGHYEEQVEYVLDRWDRPQAPFMWDEHCSYAARNVQFRPFPSAGALPGVHVEVGGTQTPSVCPARV